nr:hypothetical protein [uncultured Rhodopila sp.]
MTSRVVLTDATKPRVVLADAPKPRAGSAVIANALGAAEVADAPAQGGSPVSWYAIRAEVADRLRSTGGRPGLPGAEPRKVTLTQEEWDMIRDLADAIAQPGFRPSAGQVAGVLLGRAVRSARASLNTDGKPL